MRLKFATDTVDAIPLHVIEKQALAGWLEGQPDRVSTWVMAAGFKAALGGMLLIPGEEGRIEMALAGYGTADERARGRFHLAAVAPALPEGVYRLHGLEPGRAGEEALGWLLAGYAFDRYRAQNPAKALLIAPDGVDAARLEVIAKGEALTRDLINTPASDMGPDDLEAACVDLAARHGAR
ncbi:Peptidase B, partial [hydrothermal vent metagenome]